MIYGTLDNLALLKKQTILFPLIMMAKSVDTGDNLGKVCFLNNQIYANFDKSLTESINDRKMEFHKDYLDVHIMLNGVEKIGFYQSPICDQDIELCPFDKTKDLGFVKDREQTNYLTLTENSFAVFFPGELHKPLCSVVDDISVRKIVLKVHKDFLN